MHNAVTRALLAAWLLAGPSVAAAAPKADPLPDLQTSVATDVSSPTDAAVVVGVEVYPYLPDVPYANRDAQAFKQFLRLTRGVPVEHVEFLDGSPSKEKIETAVGVALESVGPGGTLWFYFSGHGIASRVDGRRLLLGGDTQPEDESFESRAVDLDVVKARFEASEAANVVVVVDACYTGFGREGRQLQPGEKGGFVPHNAIVAQGIVAEWAASRENQTSLPYDPAQQGLFTYFLVGGLKGWADGVESGERDGKVTMAEVDTYVTRALHELGAAQHPVLAYEDRYEDWTVVDHDGLEPGPELSNLPRLAAISADGSAPVADRVAELRRKSDLLQSQADRDWQGPLAASKAGDPGGPAALEMFIDTYGDASVVVGGEIHSVDIGQMGRARSILADYDGYWRKYRQRSAGAVLLVSGLVVTSGGGALAGIYHAKSVQEENCGGCYDADAYRSYRNTMTGGLVVLGVGAAISVSGIVNLALGGRRAPVAMMPGPVTTVTVHFP